jgi:hypothetical protein
MYFILAFAFTARAWGNGMELYAFGREESQAYAFTARALDKNLDYAFFLVKIHVSSATYTLCPPRRRWRKTQANFRMHQKRRFGKSPQHKATLMEEELRHEQHDNAVIPDAPPPAAPPPTESPNQPPTPAVKRAVRRRGI